VSLPGGVANSSGIERVVSQIAFALSTVADAHVVESVALPILPPALVIGPPRMSVRGYTYAGAGVTTAQFNIYAVVIMNQCAIENLRQMAVSVMYALERYTPGVVLSSVPGVYPSSTGTLPAYIVTYQVELR
jgi:hypothetical protein